MMRIFTAEIPTPRDAANSYELSSSMSHIIYVAHHQGHADRVRQSVEDGFDLLLPTAGFEAGFDGRRNIKLAKRIRGPIVDVAQFFALVRLQVIQAVIYFDLLAPSAKRRAALEDIETREGLYGYLLGEVLAVGVVFGQIAPVGQDPALVILIKRSKTRKSPLGALRAASQSSRSGSSVIDEGGVSMQERRKH